MTVPRVCAALDHDALVETALEVADRARPPRLRWMVMGGRIVPIIATGTTVIRPRTPPSEPPPDGEPDPEAA